MKNLFIIFFAILIAGCTASKETTTTKQERRMEKKLAEQEAIKRAVESRRYVIKFTKLYTTYGEYVSLVPRQNFVIINGPIASVSLFYTGPSFARPIAAINFSGHTVKYEMQSNAGKGTYNINTTVIKGSDNFDFYITIGAGGSCTLSVVNSYISSVTYTGDITPLPSDTGPGE